MSIIISKFSAAMPGNSIRRLDRFLALFSSSSSDKSSTSSSLSTLMSDRICISKLFSSSNVTVRKTLPIPKWWCIASIEDRPFLDASFVCGRSRAVASTASSRSWLIFFPRFLRHRHALMAFDKSCASNPFASCFASTFLFNCRFALRSNLERLNIE